jgi:cystathionine beta-lyase/cystathionine gamma-synthase
MKFSTKAIHVGQEADPATGATIVPIYQTSTYTQEEVGKHRGYEYSRSGNPTRAAFEKCIASLEDGKHGLAFASGLAATGTVLSILKSGDHVVAADDMYGGTYRLFERVYRPMGIGFTYVDGRNTSAFQEAMQKTTRLVWLETPTNPLLRLVDISAVTEIARKSGAAVAVDNTFASPYLQQPLKLGAHVVMHSTTKYIGGHSDVVGGALITSDDKLFEQLKFHQNAAGGVPGPFDCWLTMRGVKTLALRMRQHCENALKIAQFLTGHPKIKKVYYPGLADHPQHDLAKRQMRGFGGMVSFDTGAGESSINQIVKRLKLFSYAESLGGVESLACYPVKMTHGSIPKEERDKRGVTDSLLRLSVGIEDADDLIDDLKQALA